LAARCKPANSHAVYDAGDVGLMSPGIAVVYGLVFAATKVLPCNSRTRLFASPMVISLQRSSAHEPPQGRQGTLQGNDGILNSLGIELPATTLCCKCPIDQAADRFRP
jgi:hypothetical protein